MKKMYTKLIIMFMCMIVFTACTKEPADTDQQTQQNVEQSEEVEQEDQSVDETDLPPIEDIEEDEKYEVVLYFADQNLMSTYKVKKEIEVGKDEQLEKAALEAWIQGPDHEKLNGLIAPNTMVEYVKDVDGIAHVSFSKEIQESNLGSTGEAMLAEQTTMIMEQFGFKQTQILIEGEIVGTLLGHLYTEEPMEANDPETYQWVDDLDSREVVLENSAFKIFEPAPNSKVKDQIVVRGLARVFEATLLYEFEDGHNILDEGFTTATEGAPGWGEFEIIIDLKDIRTANGYGSIILFEESAKDGARINELIIPVYTTE